MKSSPAIAVTLSVACLSWLAFWKDAVPSGNQPFAPEAPQASLRAARDAATGHAPPRGLSKRRSAELPLDVLDRAVERDRFRLDLPDGSAALGQVDRLRRDAQGISSVEGSLAAPRAGRFFFQRQTAEGVAGSLVGHVLFDGETMGWKVGATGPGGAPQLVETHEDGILCVNYAQPPDTARGLEEAPQTHPTDIPIPAYQTIIPLQSLPGATGVIYLDFDGEQGPFDGWGDFDAAPATANNSQIYEVWKMVSEDFQGFNLNVTTDRKVFDQAPSGRRQHVIISPTTTAAPGAGGVAYIGSYNWSGSTVCWAFYSTGKSSAEVISHEVGHTLNLGHDGRTSPSEGYYGGHGTGSTGWAPIMGVGYYRTLSQWSKGEYLSANNTQDDLAVIVGNNDVDYRVDDTGATLATARHLEILANDSVSNEGIIETAADVDAFRFSTAGGAVSLTVNPVSSNPNLDLLAELVDGAGGSVIASSNPDLGIDATISTTLPAGEYLLKVSGTGRGDPLGDGYSDYGSLGSYLIAGNVAGGVKPDRFTIAENSAAGAVVGTVVPRGNHGASPLTWSIAGGNVGGAFTLNATTGQLTVATPAALDYEALSLRWDDPAAIELFVSITDPLNPALNESLRVVVTVSDVNEAPGIAGASITMLERARTGTPLATIAADDIDRFQFPVFTILAGNENDWFAIDAGTGQLRVNGSIEVGSTTTLPLTVQVTDQGTPALSAAATVNVQIVNIAAGYEPGGAMRTYFEDIGGGSVSDLTTNAKWPDHPDSEEFVGEFEGGSHGDNYGSTIRGYVIPPATGSYRFWISSDDASQLRLSTTANPANAVAIASVSGWTDPYSWPESGSQRSSLVTLTAGQPYYIEARHKEGGGGDHLAVGWSGPGISKQLLTGLYLAPYDQNYAPVLAPATFSVPEEAFAGQIVGTVAVADVNEGDSHGGFTITAGNTAGIFAIDPVTGVVRVAATSLLNASSQPVHSLTIQASDDGSPVLSGTATVTVNVLPAGTFAASRIIQQVWTGISGAALSSLTQNGNYPYKPSYVRTLGAFESGANFADNYGSRIRALVIPPASGSYTFHLSSDDDSRLLLGSGASADTAVQIASITGWSNEDEWTKYPSQTSAPVTLAAGQPYYIETLQKEGGGGDHVQVAWTGPGISSITVIPAEVLQPYDLNTAPNFAGGAAAFSVMEGSAAGSLIGTVAAIDPEGDAALHAITASSVPGAFAIHPTTGAITVANPALMGPGIQVLTVSAQDRGIGGVYPLKVGSKPVTITVISNNQPPAFSAETFVFSATEDEAFSGSVSATDPDAGDTLVFAKLAGPPWLTVHPDGTLSGTPDNDEVGPNEFTVGVLDDENFSATATLSITVTNVNDPPVFTLDPMLRPGGTEREVYLAPSLAGSATDDDASEPLIYSLVAGPPWLEVAPDGSLSGTPPAGSAGANGFTIRATDPGGSYDDAVLWIEIAAAGLPLPWDESTIGSLPAGTTVPDGDRYQITGGGALSGRNDALHFVWQPLSGDGSITARLEAMPDTGPDSRAGVMIRDTLASNSRHVFMGMTGDGGFRWVRRTGFNGNTSTSKSGSGVRPDAWLRLVRSGDTITAFKSVDGIVWVTVGSLTAAFPPTCYFGLAVAGGSPAVTSTATFSHVEVKP